MANVISNATHAAQRKMVEKVVDVALSRVKNNRQESFLKIADIVEEFLGKDVDPEQYEKVRAAVADPNNRWMKVINRVIDETDPHVAKMAVMNL